jgi:TPR repeat protein
MPSRMAKIKIRWLGAVSVGVFWSMVSPELACARTPWTQQYAGAMQAYKSGDYARARAGFQALADFGSPAAEAMLGHMYLNGLGGPRKQRVAGIWYYRAAQKGYVNAQLALGSMFATGTGFGQNSARGYFWLEVARQRGEPKVASLAKKYQIKLQPALTATQIADALASAGEWRPNAATPK